MNNNQNIESKEAYEMFKESIKNWPLNQPLKANFFINKNLNNQLKRLQKYGLRLETKNYYDIDIYDINKDKNSASEMLVNAFLSALNNSNNIFKNQAYMTTGVKESTYYLNNRKLKKISYKNRLFINVTSVNDSERVLKEDYTCPNCGNVVPISELLNGCKYCKAKFTISDFYPVVTNYYHCNMEKEKIHFLSIYLIIFILVFLILLLSNFDIMQFIQEENNEFTYLSPTLFNILFSAIISLLFAFFAIIGRTIILAISYYGKKYDKKEKYTQLENYVRQIDSNFTYYFFEGKIISMLKEAIFCDDCSKLNIFESSRSIDFSNIIDADFTEMYVKNYYSKDGLLYIDLDIEMYNTLYKNGKIRKKEQTFCATVARNLDVITSSKFRFENIKCNSCGATIDVSNDNTCKYCKNVYDFKQYDFVFKDLYLK